MAINQEITRAKRIRDELDFVSIHSTVELDDRLGKLDMDELYTLMLYYGCQLKNLNNKIWQTEITGAKK